MKIGIIVYSQTGNTLLVANKLYKELKDEKYDVTIEEIKANRDMKNSASFEFTNKPKVDKYDVIIFASYVEAFMLCPVMMSYLKSIESLKNIKSFSFITHHFPYAWMGGNHAIKMMNKIIIEKESILESSYVIDWSNKKCLNEIDDLVSNIKIQLSKKTGK